MAREAATITARGGGAVIGTTPIGHSAKKYPFSGGIDQVEIVGNLASVLQLCFLPGWTCVGFDAQTFPQGATGSVSYAGVTLVTTGTMSVDTGTLEVDAPPLRILVPMGDLQLIAIGSADAPAVLPIEGLVEPALVDLPAIGPVQLVPGVAAAPVPLRPAPLRRLVAMPDAPATQPPAASAAATQASAGIARVWVLGNKTPIATVTIVFPAPVTRARVVLAGAADVIAYAGSQEVARRNGVAGASIALYADPTAPSHLGWIDRLVAIAASQVRITDVCVDSGTFGWARFDQWKWSQGVQRSVELLYRRDPVLPPGSYVLRVHTAAVETGARSRETAESCNAAFTVGKPPGFPTGASAADPHPTYPAGGPLTMLFDLRCPHHAGRRRATVVPWLRYGGRVQ